MTNPRRAAKRAALKKAAEERARTRRRRQWLLAGLGGVAAAGIIVLLVVVIGHATKHKPGLPSAASQVSAPASLPAASAATSESPAPQVSVPAALAKKPVVTATGAKPTKLTVNTLVAGTGPAVKNGQTLTVNYVGVAFSDNKEFDSSWKGGQPFSFQLGGQVIQGWNQGLQGVKVGSRVQLDIPSNLAYGDDASGGAPAGPLRFVVDVLAAA
jgi:peptidylprolyl isomerase